MSVALKGLRILETIGILTFSSLQIFKMALQQSRVSVMKRAALMFDCILLPTEPGAGVGRDQFLTISGNSNIREIDPVTKTKEYLSMFLDVSDITENTKEYRNYLFDVDYSDFWGGEKSKDYINLAKKMLQEVYGQKANLKDELEFLLPNLSEDIKIYRYFTDRKEGLLPIVTEWHSRMIQEILNESAQNPDRVMRSLADRSIPDFASLSWEDIMKLRKDGLVGVFRNKMNEFITTLTTDKPDSIVVDHFTREIDSTMWELVGSVTPNMPSTILGGIMSNVPLPIPVNPVSIGLAGKDIYEKHKLRSNYGWLMLINKARGLSSK